MSLFMLLTASLPGVAQTGEAQTFKGRLLDGTKMYREALVVAQSGGFKDIETSLANLNPVPLAGSDFTLFLVHGTQHTPLSRGRTDAAGAFEVSLREIGGVPLGGRIVAAVESPDLALFSMPVTPNPSGTTELKLYKTSDTVKFVTSSAELVLTLTDDPQSNGKLLRCRFLLKTSTIAGDLFVGSPLRATTGTRRALWRIPIPDNAQDKSASAVKLHDNSETDGWTFTNDGWALVDNPLPPFLEAPRGVLYRLEYSVPARQTSAIVFPVDFPQRAIQVRGIHKDMELLTPTLAGEIQQEQLDPDDGVSKTWEIHYASDVQPSVVSVGLSIDSMALGQVNEHTLKVVGGFVIAALIAVILGLVLARSGPKVETLLSEATGEEIIERIAQLDAQFEQGRVTKAEYESVRERLLSLARYEVPELSSSGTVTGPAPAGGPALPPGVVDVLDRIQEIESDGAQDSRKIQERVLLLEELARSLRQMSGAPVTEDAEESR